MSLYSGSLGYKKYFVIGVDQTFSIAEIDRLQKPFRFSSKKLSIAVQAEFCGWVQPASDDMADTTHSSHWSASDGQIAHGWTLRMCCVRRKVPSLFLKMTVEERLNQMTKKELEGLTRSSRKELKDQIQQELLAQALPQFSYVDAVWRDQTQELYVFTNSKSQISRFESIFMKSFGHPLKLDMISDGYFTNRVRDVYSQAKDTQTKTKHPKAKELLDKLTELQPTRFSINSPQVIDLANHSIGSNNS